MVNITQLLNTIGNRKEKKVNDVEIIQTRLDAINIVKTDQYTIVENIKKNILRISTIIYGEKVDINVSMNKKSKDEATLILENKFNKIRDTLQVKKGKVLLDWN